MLYLAPIRGITDRIYRNCLAKHFPGIDVAITPFVQTQKGDQIKPTHLQENDPKENALAIIPQIIGNNPDHFIELSRQLGEAGNKSVNWNLGCPYPTMTKKKRGAGLLPYPDNIDRFLDKVCNGMSLGLSIKIRLGLKSPQEITQILPVLNRYPLEHITIHARLGKQMYEGTVDLEAFETCIGLCEKPIIYNGDINTLADLMEQQERFPTIQNWMLGRGLLANPFLLEEIQNGTPPTHSEKTTRLKAFHDDLLNAYVDRLSGANHQITRMLAHWEYLGQDLPDINRAMKRMRKSKTITDYRIAVTKLLQSE